MVNRRVQIGNSQDMHLPKKIIEQFHFSGEIEAEIQKDGLLLRKKQRPGTGWNRQIQKEIKKNGFPEMLIPDHIQNDFDQNEWQWDKEGDRQVRNLGEKPGEY